MLNVDALKAYADEGYNVLLSGKHGVGKTAVIKLIFDEKFGKINESWKYFSASTLDPWVDFIGVPDKFTNKDGVDVFKILPPESFTGQEKIRAIFFDEINRADEKTLNAIMELIQFRSINGRKFPHLECIWAAENPADDDDNAYSVRTLDPAQRDRFNIQINVPYALDREYFVTRYGETIFNIGREWWDRNERKKVISPRKLDDMLSGFVRGFDITDFTNLIDITELKTNLNSVGRFEQYKTIAATNNEAKIKRFFTIAKIREAENLFPSLDPKSTIFDKIYPHLDEEVQSYVAKTFNYDHSARGANKLSAEQLEFINNMGLTSKPTYNLGDADTIRKGIKAVNELFTWEDLFKGKILDVHDINTIMPFKHDREEFTSDTTTTFDLANAIASLADDKKEFEKFYIFAVAAVVSIAKEKGVEYMENSPVYQWIMDVHRSGVKSNRVYNVSVTAIEIINKKLKANELSTITEDEFQNDHIFYRN